MKLNKVIIAYKKTLHKLPIDKSARKGSFATSSSSYADALNLIAGVLKKYGISSSFVDRSKMRTPMGADLIVSLGGDGTVLAASHYASDIPILGVNFMPKTSVGFFCRATLKNFSQIIKQILDDKISQTYLPMMEIQIDGKILKTKALNDVLFSSPSPAEMSRYKITIDNKSENQRSSGVWVAAGPGSTAAIASAGGKKLLITSSKIQYLVREACPLPGVKYNFTKGILSRGQDIEICSNMSNAYIYVDGPEYKFAVKRGSSVRVRVKDKALRMYL